MACGFVTKFVELSTFNIVSTAFSGETGATRTLARPAVLALRESHTVTTHVNALAAAASPPGRVEEAPLEGERGWIVSSSAPPPALAASNPNAYDNGR